MPQFILDESGEVNGRDFGDLDAFTQGFIECGFFQSECPQVDREEFATEEHQEAMREGSTDGTIPADVSFGDLSEAALSAIVTICQQFQQEAGDLLSEAYGRGYDEEQAGRDYWYTHTGAGVGFWDRDILGERGEWERLGSPRVGEPGWDEYAKAKENSLGQRLSKAAGRGEFYLEWDVENEEITFYGY
jgi:hypothetical protein